MIYVVIAYIMLHSTLLGTTIMTVPHTMQHNNKDYAELWAAHCTAHSTVHYSGYFIAQCTAHYNGHHT